MTLGEAFDEGKLPNAAEFYETLFGREWRSLDRAEAKTRANALQAEIDEQLDELAADEAATDQELEAAHERLRISTALMQKVIAGHPTSDELVAETLRDLYGDEVPPSATDAALEVLSDLARLRRGELLDE